MPDDVGHTFRFTVQSRGSHRLEDGTMADSNWWGDPWTLEVRAWSLDAALAKARELGVGAWDTGEEPEPE